MHEKKKERKHTHRDDTYLNNPMPLLFLLKTKQYISQ